ncbi:MAG: hypothetical protein K2X09_05730 [Rickettsiales bacterium]|nr:hypothetical protein [Rickettsiales bacterium]
MPASILRTSAEEVAVYTRVNGLEPEKVADFIVAAQLPDYQRLTDPTIKFTDRPNEDRTEISLWRDEIAAGLGTRQYKFVRDTAEQDVLVAGPEVVSALSKELSQRSQKTGVQTSPPSLIYDNEQVEPYRFDRAANALFINGDQLKGNIDHAALDTALDIRDDRSPERLAQELRGPALAFAEEELPPAYDRAANRVKIQAENEGWADDKPRLRDAMVEAAYPLYREATDPANPAATQKAQNKFFSREGVTKVSEEFHPEILAMAAMGTAKLNNPAKGKNYAPPAVAIVEGEFVKSGSPAKFDNEKDIIILDAEYVRENPEALEGVIDHELGHRDQRKPQDFKDELHKEYSKRLGIPSDAKVLERMRNREFDADEAGASVVGAAEMKEDLKQSLDWSKEEAKSIDFILANGVQPSSPSSAAPKPEETHPSDEARYARLDALLAKEGVKKQSYNPQGDVGINDVEERGPSSAPAPQPEPGPRLQASASR